MESAHLLVPAALEMPWRSKPLELLPREYRRAVNERRLFHGALMVGGLAVLMTVLMVAMQYVQLHKAEDARVDLTNTMSRLQNSEAYQGVVLMQTQSAAWQMQLAQLRGTSFAHSEFLRALSQLTPDGIFLTDLQLQIVQNEQGVQVAAVSMSGFLGRTEQYPEVALSRYVKTLQEQPVVKRIHLQNQTYENIDNDRRLRFTIVLEAAA